MGNRYLSTALCTMIRNDIHFNKRYVSNVPKCWIKTLTCMISSQTRNVVRDFQNPWRTSFQRLTSTLWENTRSKSKAASATISGGSMRCYGRPSQFTIVAALQNLIKRSPQNAESCSMSHSFKSLFLLVAVKLKKIVKVFCSSRGIRHFSSSGDSPALCARELDALKLTGSFQIVKSFKSFPNDT